MGDSSNLVTLCCPDHHETLVVGLWHLATSKYGLNCDLRAGGRSIRAHRLVAEVFLAPHKLASLDNHQVESELRTKFEPEEQVRLEPEVCASVDDVHLAALLEFLYTGRVTVRQDHLDKLLVVARELDFRLLIETIEKTRAVGIKLDSSDTSVKASDQTNDRTLDKSRKPQRCVTFGKACEISSAPGVKSCDDFPVDAKTSDSLKSEVKFVVDVKFPDDATKEMTTESLNIYSNDVENHMVSNGESDVSTVALYVCDSSTVALDVSDAFKMDVDPSDNSRLDSGLGESFVIDQKSIDTFENTVRVDDRSKSMPNAVEFGRKASIKSVGLKTEVTSVENVKKMNDLTADAAILTTSASNVRRSSQRQRKIPAKFLFADESYGERDCSTPAKKRVKLIEPKKELTSNNHRRDSHPYVTTDHEVLIDAVQPNRLLELTHPSDVVDSGEQLTEAPDVDPVKPEPASYVNGGPQVATNTKTTTAPSQRKYSCDRCEFHTNNETTYHIHQANHDPNSSVFPCPFCSKMFLSQVSLQGHRCVKSTTPKMYACQYCEYWDRDKAAFRVHQLDAHGVDGGPVFRCDECERPFLSFQTLERHVAEKHGGPRSDIFRCPHCKYETPKVWSYNHHLFSEHRVNAKGEMKPQQQPTRIRCPKCDQTCRNQQSLRAHLQTRHRPDKGVLECPQCPFNVEAHRKRLLNRHLREHHPGNNEDIIATTTKTAGTDADKTAGTDCSHVASTPYDLDEHLSRHVGSKSHVCDVCQKVLSDRNTLRRHVLIHVNKDKDKPYRCPACPYSSNRRDNLRTHLRNVHKINSYQINSNS